MLLLTQQSGILKPFAIAMGWIMEWIFNILNAIGIGNIGLTIILFTIVIRLILLPMTIKQQQFSKMTQLMQPEMKKIQKKYRGKKDQASMAKQNEEIQDLYAKYGVSPSGSCLQMLIQMPILFALYRVMYNIPAYIGSIKELFINIITPLQQVPDFQTKLYEVQQAANIKPGLIKLISEGQTNIGVDQMVDVMNKFTPEAWNKLQEAFSGNTEVINAISTNVPKIQEFNNFLFGINLTESPANAGIFSVYILIPLAAAFFSFLSSYSMMSRSTVDKNDPTAKMSKGMMIYMPIMSAFISFGVPAGLGLYWAMGSLVMWVQQILINRHLDHMDIEKFIAKNRAKAEKKAAKGKKSFMQKMAEMEARNAGVPEEEEKNQRSISDIASINTKKVLNKATTSSDGKSIGDLESPTQTNANMGSIASKANIMLNYEDKKSGNNKGGNR